MTLRILIIFLIACLASPCVAENESSVDIAPDQKDDVINIIEELEDNLDVRVESVKKESEKEAKKLESQIEDLEKELKAARKTAKKSKKSSEDVEKYRKAVVEAEEEAKALRKELAGRHAEYKQASKAFADTAKKLSKRISGLEKELQSERKKDVSAEYKKEIEELEKLLAEEKKKASKTSGEYLEKSKELTRQVADLKKDLKASRAGRDDELEKLEKSQSAAEKKMKVEARTLKDYLAKAEKELKKSAASKDLSMKEDDQEGKRLKKELAEATERQDAALANLGKVHESITSELRAEIARLKQKAESTAAAPTEAVAPPPADEALKKEIEQKSREVEALKQLIVKQQKEAENRFKKLEKTEKADVARIKNLEGQLKLAESAVENAQSKAEMLAKEVSKWKAYSQKAILGFEAKEHELATKVVDLRESVKQHQVELRKMIHQRGLEIEKTAGVINVLKTDLNLSRGTRKKEKKEFEAKKKELSDKVAELNKSLIAAIEVAQGKELGGEALKEVVEKQHKDLVDRADKFEKQVEILEKELVKEQATHAETRDEIVRLSEKRVKALEKELADERSEHAETRDGISASGDKQVEALKKELAAEKTAHAKIRSEAGKQGGTIAEMKGSLDKANKETELAWKEATTGSAILRIFGKADRAEGETLADRIAKLKKRSDAAVARAEKLEKDFDRELAKTLGAERHQYVNASKSSKEREQILSRRIAHLEKGAIMSLQGLKEAKKELSRVKRKQTAVSAHQSPSTQKVDKGTGGKVPADGVATPPPSPQASKELAERLAKVEKEYKAASARADQIRQQLIDKLKKRIDAGKTPQP